MNDRKLSVPSSLLGMDGPDAVKRIDRQAKSLSAAMLKSPPSAWEALVQRVDTVELESPVLEIRRGPPAYQCYTLDLLAVFFSLVRAPPSHVDGENEERKHQRDSKVRLLKAVPWGRLGISHKLHQWTHEPRWFLAEFNDACRCSDFDGLLFQDDRGTVRTYLQRTLSICHDELRVWLGGNYSADIEAITRMTELVLSASADEIAEALVEQLSLKARDVNNPPAATQIRSYVHNLAPRELESVRLAGWNELRRVLVGIQRM